MLKLFSTYIPKSQPSLLFGICLPMIVRRFRSFFFASAFLSLSFGHTLLLFWRSTLTTHNAHTESFQFSFQRTCSSATSQNWLSTRAQTADAVWDALNEHEEDEAAQQRYCEQVSVREKIKSTLHTRQDQTWGIWIWIYIQKPTWNSLNQYLLKLYNYSVIGQYQKPECVSRERVTLHAYLTLMVVMVVR